MEQSDGWLAGAIIFSVLNLLVIICSLCWQYCSDYMRWAVAGSDALDKDEEEEKAYKIHIWLTIVVYIPVLIACTIIMWLLYTGDIKNQDNEIIFWIVTTIPFVITCCLCCISSCWVQIWSL